MRRALGKDFGRAFRMVMDANKPDIVVIQEPRCSGALAPATICKLGFNHSITSDTRGFSGGI